MKNKIAKIARIDNLSDLHNHKARQLGFWLAPIIISFAMAIVSLFETIQGLIFQLGGDHETNYLIQMMVEYGAWSAPVLIILFLNLIAAAFLTGKADHFWRRNVIGYRIAFWRNKPKDFHFAVFGPGLLLDDRDIPEGSIVMIIPLGGWFLRWRNLEGGFWLKKGVRWFENLVTHNWRPSVQEWIDSGPLFTTVKTKDAKGEYHLMFISQAIDFFQIMDWLVVSDPSVSWHGLFMNALQRLESVVQAAQEKLELVKQIGLLQRESEEERKRIVGVLASAIDRLNRLKLTIKSPAINTLYRELVEQILACLPPGDPLRPGYEAEEQSLKRMKAASQQPP